MYRSSSPTTPFRNNVHSIQWQHSLARLIITIFLVISVCAALKYAYFPDRRVMIAPGESRLFEASSLFLREMEVRIGGDKKGILVYGFSEKPRLSLNKNWNISHSLTNVPANARKGFSLWLNKGSMIHIRLETRTSTALNQLKVSLIKGEKNRGIMEPSSYVFNATHLYEPTRIGMESEYFIKEDDNYLVSITNINSNSINTTIFINVASKMYDIAKADSVCDSSSTGSCRYRLSFMFPTNKFLVIVDPSPYDVGDDGWYVELAFIARLVTYIAILGFFVIIALLILRYFGACNSEIDEENNVYPTPASVSTMSDPLIRDKTYGVPYGKRAEDEDDDEGSSSSGEDIYDGKICVICYDMMRNCFFVPCGHCATCHNCALRIMEGETKVCPICRRLIHKVRKLLIP